MEGCATGRVLHGSAITTEAVRRAIPRSQESLRTLAKRYGVNQKMVAKRYKGCLSQITRWVARRPTQPFWRAKKKQLSPPFRRHRLLPPDDCLYALQATVPHLTMSSLHRCLQRHGITRLSDVEGDKRPKNKGRSYPMGYFHIDIAEVQTVEGKLYLFVAIDPASKFAFV